MADDEARARATLVEMQGRILQGPNTALGVAVEASPEEVRAAFLALTKQFHPARFGRMSTELQRLSNEVFLGIKFAHEAMMRALGAPMRAGLGSGAPRTGMIPMITAEGSTRTATGTTPTPRGTQPGARGTQPQPQPAPQPQTPTPRAATPPFGVRVGTPPTTRPGTPPITRSGTPPTTRPGTPPLTRSGTPPTTRPGTPPLTPPKPTTLDAETIRGQGSRAPGAFDEDAERKRAFDLLAAKNWTGARQALEGLGARIPQHLRETARSKEFRALLCVTRGREAQAGGRGSEAMLEFQRALEIDPELEQAKSALAELLRRR